MTDEPLEEHAETFGAEPARLDAQAEAAVRERPDSGPEHERSEGEAARAIGMSYWQSMFSVILPQAES